MSAFQKLELWDSNGTVSGGQFVVNGVAQTGGHEIDVAPADLSKTVYDVGTMGGSDTLWARLQQFNGTLTPWQQLTVTAPLDNAPTVAVANTTATAQQVFAAGSLFGANDADGDALTQYGFWNTGAGGGRFLLNGFTQPLNQEIDVSAAQLSHLVYQAGSGTDTLWVRVNDGAQWSSWSNAFTVTVPASTAPAADTAPAVSVTSITAFHGESFAAANLFAAHDAENNPIAQYGFWNSGAGGGHFVLNGVAQVVNQEIDVTAAQLSHLSYQSGSGADTLWVRANDGTLWSGWSSSLHGDRAHRQRADCVGAGPHGNDSWPGLCGAEPVHRAGCGERHAYPVRVLEHRHGRRAFPAQWTRHCRSTRRSTSPRRSSPYLRLHVQARAPTRCGCAPMTGSSGARGRAASP